MQAGPPRAPNARPDPGGPGRSPGPATGLGPPLFGAIFLRGARRARVAAAPRSPEAAPARPPALTFLRRSMRTLLFPPLSKLRCRSSARRSITRSSLSGRRRLSDSEAGRPGPARDADSPRPAGE